MLPECGELKISGPRQSAGSMISNGGSSSLRVSLMRGGGVLARADGPMVARSSSPSLRCWGLRLYPVYDLLRVPLSMSSPLVPSDIGNSPHFYRHAGLFADGHTGRAWGGITRRKGSGRSGA